MDSTRTAPPVATEAKDAPVLLGVVRAVSGSGVHVGETARQKVVREAIWFLWEEPRLPGPRVGNKYPVAYPWSAAASDIARLGRRPADGWGLVIEHLHPLRNLISELLRTAPDLTVARLQQLLDTHLTSAVITKAEDADLTRAGVAAIAVESTDPWHRYRLAGLAVDTFRPLLEGSGEGPSSATSEPKTTGAPS